ncbi:MULTISPECIES: outer membrane protein assembly factor BamA [unclassified Roseovarius]|uniref:outer membrane protein assembly factor BamA n=1 Tax=Roseovarius sp. (strain 217) TaxID=314264 RepID=UPI0000685839|nr:outer membrane protein, OMP85 family protein [Roseovarius sp. 217]KJS42126.1 MAG: outer membrane protein assembly complex, YaeT protein [Roseovarius sp. BRH_c41]
MNDRDMNRQNSRNVFFALRTVKAALVSVIIATFLLGTGQRAEAQSYRFSSVSIEGNQRIEAGTILSYAGIARNETVSAGQLNDAYQKVLTSGLFEEVELVPQGNNLLIRVTEFPTINRIAFEGNDKIKDEDLAGFIQSKSRQVFSPTQAERDAGIISEAYSQNGRIAARVTPKVIRRSDNRVDLVFEIFEGRKIEVQRIGFVGNRAFSDTRLRRVVESKQTGLLRALIERDTFVEDRVNFDRQVLTDFYNSRGYVDFRVTGTNAELARERDAYFVTFNVQEGQQFKFGQITTVSEMNGVEAETYHDTLKIKPGVVYSPTLVENSIARMERLAIKNGVDFLRVEPRITRNDRDLTLNVEFALQRGPRIFVERIDIEGNTTTLDRVIRRQFDQAEGDPFNPRSIQQAATRIRALGYFKEVDVNAREGSRPDQVVIETDVEEQTTGTVSVGASFSTNSGLGISLGFSERNFIGRGQRLTAQILATADSINYNLGFVEPAFLGRDVALGLDFSFQETESDNSLFDTAIGTFRPSLTFPTGENTRLGVYYNASYEDMSDYQGTSGILLDEINQGALWTSSVGYNFNYDTRESGLNPNAGVLLSFGQEFAGLGGDNDYIKTTARLVGQTTVMNEDVTLRAILEGGAIEFSGGQSSRFLNRFGSQVIRGFEPNGMGPIEDDELLGGDYFAALKFEAEFPLGLPDEYGITGGAFYDIGSIWGIGNRGSVAPGNTLSSTGFKARHVVGFSIFWSSPFGPIRMNFSNALKKEPGDIEQQFDLTVRTEF